MTQSHNRLPRDGASTSEACKPGALIVSDSHICGAAKEREHCFAEKLARPGLNTIGFRAIYSPIASRVNIRQSPFRRVGSPSRKKIV